MEASGSKKKGTHRNDETAKKGVAQAYLRNLTCQRMNTAKQKRDKKKGWQALHTFNKIQAIALQQPNAEIIPFALVGGGGHFASWEPFRSRTLWLFTCGFNQKKRSMNVS